MEDRVTLDNHSIIQYPTWVYKGKELCYFMDNDFFEEDGYKYYLQTAHFDRSNTLLMGFNNPPYIHFLYWGSKDE